MDKRPRESSSSRYALVGEVFRLEEKVDNLEFLVGLVYKKLNCNAIEIRIEEIEVPTHPREKRRMIEESSNNEDDSGEVPLSMEHQGASTSGVVASPEIKRGVDPMVFHHVDETDEGDEEGESEEESEDTVSTMGKTTPEPSDQHDELRAPSPPSI